MAMVTLLAKSKYLRDKELKNEKAMVQKVYNEQVKQKYHCISLNVNYPKNHSYNDFLDSLHLMKYNDIFV